MWDWIINWFFYYDWNVCQSISSIFVSIRNHLRDWGNSIFYSFSFDFVFLISLLVFHYYNKKYLAPLKSLFSKMQTEGYIESDLVKYPESLQMAFWEHHWFDWHKDLNHCLHHWVWWYGFLALKHFFINMTN